MGSSVGRMRRRGLWLAIGLGVGVAVACGSDGESTFGGDDADASISGDGGGNPFGDGGGFIVQDASNLGPCNTTADCDGGVCVEGVCCATVGAYCGGQCCPGGSVCLFEQCVVPGKVCKSANDCGAGEYCETGFAEPTSGDGGTFDGGMSGDGGALEGGAGGDGGVCVAPVPIEGRCVARPPLCNPDAGPGQTGCLQACEYRPPVGNLTPELRWEWGPSEPFMNHHIDVWATPTVGRVYDGNCDGKVDELDPPNVIFVSGDSRRTDNQVGWWCGHAQVDGCRRGVLRMLDGRTGRAIWSLDKASPGSMGFAGMSVALGDIDGDQRIDIIAVTGEGYVVMIDGNGNVKRTSDQPIAGANALDFGWGGGVAIADVDGDGFPEIAYGRTIYTTKNNAITRVYEGAQGRGGHANQTSLSYFADVDGDPNGYLELVAGRTVYRLNETTQNWEVLWNRANADLPDGFTAIADFEKDGTPEIAHIASGDLTIVDAKTGVTRYGPFALAGGGFGGPPTIADFDGDGYPEVGVANRDFYSVLKPNRQSMQIETLWTHVNKDVSSDKTGSTVFDFEGDGQAEVIYADECFLYVWGYDAVQKKAVIKFATPHTSFTATEASLVADVDGDGHAEIVIVSNGSDPSPSSTWKCDSAPWNQPDPVTGRPAWVPYSQAQPGYRGIMVFGDKENAWVGTRTLWSQHAYHVTNTCDSRDSACVAPNLYGSVPAQQTKSWTLPWVNSFRQNVQDKGIFDAPDATVSLVVDCIVPVRGTATVQNRGLKGLPASIDVGVYVLTGGQNRLVASLKTSRALLPGQSERLAFEIPIGQATERDVFVARILIDPQNRKFHECREDNNVSSPVSPRCVR